VPPDALRQKFRNCQKNPGSITVGTYIYLARQCGADFTPWYNGQEKTSGAQSKLDTKFYRKDEVDEAIALGRTVLIVESKEDVDYLWSIGIPATRIIPTTNIENDKWKDFENADWTDFKDADVVVYERARAACRYLRGIAKRVRILRLETWTRISGHTPEGAYTREQLDALIEEAPEQTTPKPPLIVELGSKLWGPATKNRNEYRFGADQSKVIDPRKGAWFDFTTNEGGFLKDLMKKVSATANRTDIAPITYVNIAEWIDAPVPQREWAVLNRVPATNVTILSGTGGIGKTILAMMLAAAAVLVNVE